jgi:hypothetical protein
MTDFEGRQQFEAGDARGVIEDNQVGRRRKKMPLRHRRTGHKGDSAPRQDGGQGLAVVLSFLIDNENPTWNGHPLPQILQLGA